MLVVSRAFMHFGEDSASPGELIDLHPEVVESMLRGGLAEEVYPTGEGMPYKPELSSDEVEAEREAFRKRHDWDAVFHKIAREEEAQ